jgi:hypothetical protein
MAECGGFDIGGKKATPSIGQASIHLDFCLSHFPAMAYSILIPDRSSDAHKIEKILQISVDRGE